MKNIKKKLRYSINICLMIILIFASVSIGQAAVSADRTIESNMLTAGNGTNITVVIQNDITQALSLKEIIPSGWNLTRISDSADQFKTSTNEWMWISLANDTVETVEYRITVPSGTAPGIYNINGNITTNENTTSVDGDNTIEVVSNSVVPPVQGVQGAFGFVVNPSSLTVNIGENAIYNLTISNTGSVADTYGLVANQPSNTAVTLDKNSVTVGVGNSSVVELTVSGSATGTYTVNVTATSRTNASNRANVTTTTNVIIPTLAIENFTSVPSTAISSVNPAKISANVKKGIFNILLVEFGFIDINNLLGKGQMIFAIDSNTSGVQGLYSLSWSGNYATIGNVAVADIVTVHTESRIPYSLVTGTFKANNTSNGTDAILYFNKTTGNLFNVTDLNGRLLNIRGSNSTFRANISKFVNGSVVSVYTSTNVSTLYDMTGNMAVNNPRIVVNTVPNGKYRVYAVVEDANNSVAKVIDIDTIPPSAGSGGRSSSSSGGGNGGTYPTVTATPKKNATTTATPTETATVQQTVERVATTAEPVETVSKMPVAPTEAPGFEIIVAIGAFGVIYILRRMK